MALVLGCCSPVVYYRAPYTYMNVGHSHEQGNMKTGETCEGGETVLVDRYAQDDNLLPVPSHIMGRHGYSYKASRVA